MGEDSAQAEACCEWAGPVGVGEEGLARAPGPGEEAGLQGSEAWGEPLGEGAGGSKPEPGWNCSLEFEEGTGSGAVAEEGFGGASLDLWGYFQGVEGLCSSPGSFLGLTP